MPNPDGRPSGYDPVYAKQVEKLCELGATDFEIGSFFGVSVRTIHRWKVDFPEFCHSLKVGKEASDNRIERSLFEKASGYDFIEQQAFKVKVGKDLEEVTVVDVERHMPPDTTAMIFWLKNRRKSDWRDKVDHELTGKDGQPLTVQILRFSDHNSAS